MKEKRLQDGGVYWKKIKGLTLEEFERIETLESAITKCEEEIEEFKKEISIIQKAANARRENTLKFY